MGDVAGVVATGSMQHLHKLSNGMTLVGERMEGVRSVAVTMLVPAGAASDPVGGGGAATVLSDWVLRGAGKRDSRELTGYLDGLGVSRSCHAETVFLRLSGVMLGKNLLKVLPVFGDVVMGARLEEEGFGPSVDLAVQQLDAIEDEPASKLSLLLRGRHFGFPFGRPSVGVREELEGLTVEGLRADYGKRFTPTGTILAVAGFFEWGEVVRCVEEAFGGWAARPAVELVSKGRRGGVEYLKQKTNQSQIGLAWETVREADGDSILMQTAMNVLSGGMGARLFTEIREKQGLCYSVQAGYSSLKHVGAVFGYAGTSPERAQRTLDSFVVELERLGKGITQEELDRAKIGMKSRVIMQGESSGARAGSIAHDFYHRGRTRTLEEVRGLIEGVTLGRVNDFLAGHPVGKLTVVTIGPGELEVKGRKGGGVKVRKSKVAKGRKGEKKKGQKGGRMRG